MLRDSKDICMKDRVKSQASQFLLPRVKPPSTEQRKLEEYAEI